MILPHKKAVVIQSPNLLLTIANQEFGSWFFLTLLGVKEQLCVMYDCHSSLLFPIQIADVEETATDINEDPVLDSYR